ncbi:MAG TPA: hypothetical protein VFI21_04275 [Nocardioides sp.]|nr:hypothetical protein [Nocardioides sp.]
MNDHAVYCEPDGDRPHRLVRVLVHDGAVVAEIRAAASGDAVSRAQVVEHVADGGSRTVVVACPCGRWSFDVGRYLDGEWVTPQKLG